MDPEGPPEVRNVESSKDFLKCFRNFGFFFKEKIPILGGVLQMLILAVVPKVKCLKDNITTTI